MKFLPTFRGLVLTSLAIAAAGGGGAYWFYSRSDEFLKQELLRQLGAMFPECRVDLDRARFDLAGRIRAHAVALTLPDDDAPALSVAELVISLDRDQLADAQAAVIHKVRLVRPQVRVVRHVDHSWNWQRLRVARGAGGVLPDVEIEYGTVTVQWEQPDALPAVEVIGTEVRLSALASSEQSWTATMTGRVDGLGPVRVRGEWGLDGKPWKLSADTEGLVIDQRVIAKALLIRPDWRRYLDDAESRIEELSTGVLRRPEAQASANRSARRGASIGGHGRDGLKDLGIQLLTDVSLQMASGEDGPDFSVEAAIRNGRITNPLLPLPLHEVSGSFMADRTKIELTDLRGRHGEAVIHFGGLWTPTEPPTWSVRGRRIVIDEVLSSRVPAPLQKLLQAMNLAGVCDFDAEFLRTEQGCVPKVDLALTRGSMTHEKFRYPVRDVEGTLSWRGELAILEARGRAGTSPITATGTIKNPGPGAEMTIELRAEELPIDAALLEACPELVRRAAAALEVRGRADFWARLKKPAGLGEKMTPYIIGRLRDCSMKYEKFPLPVDRITGLLHWDGETARFERLQGRHAGADITASGTYWHQSGNGKLDLTLGVTNASFGEELFAALPERLQAAWQEFRPSGRFDAQTQIAWSPGRGVDVRISSATLREGEVTLRSFPFPWYNVAGQFSYADDELKVVSLSAEHDDCRLRGAGQGTFAADRPWKFKFTEFFVDDLPTTPALRRALPPELRTVIDGLNPSGSISLHGPITFFGPDDRRDDVGITWNTDIVFSGSDLTLGIAVKNIHGRVTLRGAWDGEHAVIQHGYLDIDSLEVFQHQLTQVKGPFRYQRGELIAGSQQAIVGPLAQAAKDIHWEDQISGRAIDGLLLLNGIVQFEDEPRYQLRMFLNGGNLERYAQTYLNGQTNIRGNLNGWMELRGHGTDANDLSGAGRLKIQPAELYELPVFMQLFRVLGPQLQDRSAFKEADFKFTVAGSRFNFSSIILDGNAIRLIGRGYVRFDGVISLEFYSQLSRSQMRIPLISDLVGMMSRGWVGVTVAGQIQDPQVEMRPIPELDDALRQFLGVFEPTLLVPPNRLTPPKTGNGPAPSRR